VDPSAGKPDGFEDDPSVRVGQGGAGVKKKPGDSSGGSGGSRTSEPKDRPGDTPLGVTGSSSRGRPRQLVKGDSIGLWFQYDPLPGNSHLWEFEFERGVLIFNIRHPVWAKLDETSG